MTKDNTANKEKDDNVKIPDPVALGHALLDAYEKAQPLLEEYIKKIGSEEITEHFGSINFDPLNVRESYIHFLDRLAADPSKFIETQAKFAQDWFHLWQESVHRFLGNTAGKPIIEPDAADRRFKAPEWQESALFDFIKQSYLLTCKHLENIIQDVEGLTPKQKEKLAFQTKLFTNALSPTNFVVTNPEVLNETIKTGGQNLVKGLENLIKDLERGHGELDISTTNYEAFKLGENIAVTPGEVVFQNNLMQLIQYAPQTKEVNETPVLIIPPWINKYYILDLRHDNSLIEWAVAQGHTVFIISWVNPDKSMAKKTFEDYMQEGILTALSQIEKITKSKKTNMVGYCLGGTLLATTLSYLHTKKQESRIASATFLTTLLDFEQAGDLKLFMDDEQLAFMEREMQEKGLLSGKEMQKTFSLMRANDLIWSFVVNNYLMGREPFPFDLLYWNDDCTNMPAAMHSFYLRNMYRDNKLIVPGGIQMDGVDIDLHDIKIPCYFLSTREDHIAPWHATYNGAKIIAEGGTNVRFTLAASGHIAGVVNPPQKKKYCYWSNDALPASCDKWQSGATQHEGSWWPHWQEWLSAFGGKKIPARQPENSIEPAPGSYVKVRN